MVALIVIGLCAVVAAIVGSWILAAILALNFSVGFYNVRAWRRRQSAARR